MLNIIKHVSAEISFETWKLHYALVTAVPRSVKDTGVRLETQVGKLPFQQWPLRSKRIPACAEPSRNALDFWRWNTWALAASEGAQQGGDFHRIAIVIPNSTDLPRTSRHGGPIVVDVPYTVASFQVPFLYYFVNSDSDNLSLTASISIRRLHYSTDLE